MEFYIEIEWENEQGHSATYWDDIESLGRFVRVLLIDLGANSVKLTHGKQESFDKALGQPISKRKE